MPPPNDIQGRAAAQRSPASPAASATVEDYIKSIYLWEHRHGLALVPMGQLASSVGVTAGTATTMIKTLADAGLVAYEPRGGVRLTRKGEKLALHVVRRHRLIELFLVRVLGVDWSDVHEEAEVLEHAISDRLLDRISEHLGHPSLDPHGDPIPTAEGKIDRSSLTRLWEAPLGASVKIARVLDQEARFLKFVAAQGLRPGSHVAVHLRDEPADAITVRMSDRRMVTLGAAAACKILIVPA